MNRYVSQEVLSSINNKKLFQIIYLKKLNENDLLLPKIIKFKIFFSFNFKKNLKYITIEYIIWINKFYHFDNIFSNKYKSSYCLYDCNIFDIMCIYGHFDIVKWLYENRKETLEGCTKAAMTVAASNGYLDIVKFLHKNKLSGCTDFAIERAALNGHLNVVKWIYKNQSTRGIATFPIDNAASNGHLDIVKWLYQNCRSKYSFIATLNAKLNGHLDVLKFLKKNPSR